MPITKGFRVLVDEAMAEVTTYTVAEVFAKSADKNVQIVDIRDVRELRRRHSHRQLPCTALYAGVLGRP